jgi:hypothetical protein
MGLTGLPDEGVLLIGTLDYPILVNNASRTIAGHLIIWVPGLAQTTLAFRPGNTIPGSNMLPPGESMEVSPSPSTVMVHANGTPIGPLRSATLTAVIFADGEVVGPQAQRVVEWNGPLLQAERAAHQVLLQGNPETVWIDIERIARMPRREVLPGHDPTYSFTYRRTMEELWSIKNAPLGGLDRAMRRAHESEDYPRLWKKP